MDGPQPQFNQEGGRLGLPHYYLPPGFSDLPTALLQEGGDLLIFHSQVFIEQGSIA
jgi:hypothetical protein